jgi:ABC-type phosphate transport system substrate-binding protein
MTSSPAQVVVIAHKSVPQDTITSAKLFEYYSRETRLWDDDQPAVVFDLKPKGKTKDTFYKFLGKSINQMKSIWMVNMLSGESDPPESLSSEDEMLNQVASTPGAVGFISLANLKDNVKVLVVIKN